MFTVLLSSSVLASAYHVTTIDYSSCLHVYVCIYIHEINFILLPFLFSSEVGCKCAELGENQLSRVDSTAPLQWLWGFITQVEQAGEAQTRQVLDSDYCSYGIGTSALQNTL